MRKISIALRIFFSILLLFFIILCSFFILLHSVSYFDHEFQKFNIYGLFPREVALSNANSIIGFFDSQNELDRNFFKPDEISHLEDVKELISRAKILFLFSFLALFIMLYYNKKQASDLIRGASFLSLVLLILFVVLLTIFFEVLFIGFHQVFFTGNYAFDPSVSNMKAMFPDGFFLDFSVHVMVLAALLLLTLSLSGWLLSIISLKKGKVTTPKQ